MRGGHSVDEGDMGRAEDQPWRVFARRPSPLADLFRSESERVKIDPARVDYDGLDEGPRPAEGLDVSWVRRQGDVGEHGDRD
jgi:hypothetical protein